MSEVFTSQAGAGPSSNGKPRDNMEWIRTRYPQLCPLEPEVETGPRDCAACVLDLNEQLRIASEWNDDPPNSVFMIKENFWLIKGIVENLQDFCPPGDLPGNGQALYLNLQRAFAKVDDDPFLFFEALYPFRDWLSDHAAGQANDDQQAPDAVAPGDTDKQAPPSPKPAGSAAAETATIQPTGGRTLKEPSKMAFAVYRYQLVTGQNQMRLASDPQMMELLGGTVSQGTISRWLGKVKTWIKAGNVLPDLADHQGIKPAPMDPKRIEQGKRQDGRTPRQRKRRKAGDDD